MLKATPKLIAAVALILAVQNHRAASAAPPTGRILTLTALAGQVEMSAKDRRDAADRLLAQAAEAIEDKRFITARSLIDRAEATGAKYSIFHIGATPKSLRKRLDKEAGAADGPKPPSERFDPDRRGTGTEPNVAGPSDPFTQRKINEVVDQLDDKKSIAADHLRRGRQALAQRDATAATYHYRQAANTGATFGPGEDSPEQLAAAIAAAGSRESVPGAIPPGTNPPGEFRAREDDVRIERFASVSTTTRLPGAGARAESNRLLLEARRRLAVGDTQAAQSLLQQADRLGVAYGPADDMPANIHALIEKHAHVAEIRKRESDSPASRKQYARLLLEQADSLIGYRDYDTAQSLAEGASRLSVSFNQSETSPSDMLRQIEQYRKGGPRGIASLASATDAATRPAPASASAGDASSSKEQAAQWVRHAREALARGDLDTAEQFALRADSLGVAESAFGRGEDQPGFVLLDIQQRRRATPATRASDAASPGARPREYPVTNSLYDPRNDRTRNVLAQSDGPADGGAGDAARLYEQGIAALRRQDEQRARELFLEAYKYRDQLDPGMLQRLQDQLSILTGPESPRRLEDSDAAHPERIEAADGQRVRQLHVEVGRRQRSADRALSRDPQQALEILRSARSLVEKTVDVDDRTRQMLLRRIDISLRDADRYIVENQAEIELDQKNRAVVEEAERRIRHRVEVDEKLAELTERFNFLMNEQRFPEAELVAREAEALDADNPLTEVLRFKVRVARNINDEYRIRGKSQDEWVRSQIGLSNGFTTSNDNDPYRFPEMREWERLTSNRLNKYGARQNLRKTEAELTIERNLETNKIKLEFNNRPLNEVINTIGKIADVNIYLDPAGLSEEAIELSAPVTIALNSEISAKSALELVLSQFELGYVIKHEAVKVTSKGRRSGELKTVTYRVGDLIIPIPNFVPGPNLGINGALREAHDRLGYHRQGMFGGPPMMLASSDGGPVNGAVDPAILAQFNAAPGGGAPTSVNAGGGGPGGLGGANEPDFDSLIELITSTVEPDTWEEGGGGKGTIAPFETNLSLVVSQTQEVHEKLADLLDQLRRLQDLQVTIEVRFITLSDDFFERIGIDFDFDIDDNVPAGAFQGALDFPQLDANGVPIPAGGDGGPSVSVGINSAAIAGNGSVPAFTGDLDLQFRQGSFSNTIPTLGVPAGGFDPASAAGFGFAILSDIEAFFFLQAVQRDARTNVLEAPKVTLFDGQQAFVSDTAQRPFVTSVIPIVGDFAAAHQPVIVVLSEGTSMSIQAVVSDDRRFVRLTVIPFFSRIGPVQEFTFNGSETTVTGSSETVNADDDTTDSANNSTVTRSGTTVQLPTFEFVTVSTTVSVPDGGTVLLGGVKRLAEQRVEEGVPILSKVPYINRLFKNVGIGRETESLMMMVTPRIIIQEEEEARILGGGGPGAP